MIKIMKFRRSAESAWLDKINPLRGMSNRMAQQIYDCARGGNYAQIQWIYSEIEREDPVLMTCVERRTSALAGMGRRVSVSSYGDENLANEQKDFLQKAIDAIGNFDEAIEHLELAFFRGFAHVQPLRSADGTVQKLEILDNWNFCRDVVSGVWFWNPRATYSIPNVGVSTPDLIQIPEGELISIRRPREIDNPALSIYIRHALAEKDWGRFLERYGIPPVILTMPETITQEKVEEFRNAAEQIADARSGALPFGSSVNFASEARGTDPFTAFVEHQEKLIVLLATGGTLASLAEAGSGTLAGNAQEKVWQQIVARDAAIIGNALNKGLFMPLLQAAFPGQPNLAKFEIETETQPTADEVFATAGKAKMAGYMVEKSDLEERTGYSLELDQTLQTPSFGGGSSFPNSATRLQSAQNRLQNDSRGADDKTDGQTQPQPLSAVLAAFSKDMGPAKEKIQEIISSLSAENADEAAEKIAALLPNDPQLAGIFADEMAKVFAEKKNEQLLD